MGFFSRLWGGDPRDLVIAQQHEQIRALTADNVALRGELIRLHKMGSDMVQADMAHEREMKAIEAEAVRMERAAEVADRTGIVVEDGRMRYHLPGEGVPGGDERTDPGGEDLPS